MGVKLASTARLLLLVLVVRLLAVGVRGEGERNREERRGHEFPVVGWLLGSEWVLL